MITTSKYQFVSADSHEMISSVILLLQESNLPVADLDETKRLFALFVNDEMVGCGGLEFFENCALLRSVAVKKNFRGAGLGKLLVGYLELTAKKQTATSIYLLTTTAKDFFSNIGYDVTPRENVPAALKASSEYSFICPDSATVMKKTLS
jgi:amino-acid N-acetyltransferase